MTATRTRKLPAPLPKPVRDLIAALRVRDHDPAHADAPVLDAYARISISPDGETEKTDRQLLDILRLMLTMHCRLGEVHRDDNMSAWKRNGKRPGWRAMMGRLESKAIGGAVAWHVDRMMRQSRDLEKLIDLADKGGVVIRSCFGEYQLDDSDHRFTLRILVAAANKASDDASRRQKRKHDAMREAGVSNGGLRAFGHQTPAPGKPVSADQLERERDAVAWTVATLLDGTSMPAATAGLNTRGVTMMNGDPWYPAAVKGMVLKARHAGLIEDPDGRIIGPARDVEAIISPDDYRALRAMFAARSTGRRGRPEGATAGLYVLSGVLICAPCGLTMSAAQRPDQPAAADGSPYVIYRCPDNGCRAVGRPGNSVGGHTIVEWAYAQMIAVSTDPDHAAMVARRSAALEKLDAAIAVAARDARTLATRWGAGELADDEWSAASAALKARRARLDAERDQVAVGAAGLDQPATAAALAADWTAGTVDDRRRMLLSAMPYGIGVEPTGGRSRAPADRLFVISDQG